jgi:predicted transcriptional regulator
MSISLDSPLDILGFLFTNRSKWSGSGATYTEERAKAEQPFGTRDQILKFIETHPGSHLRQIRRALDVAMGVIQYHLYVLEKQRKIASLRRGLFKRFYPSLKFEERDQEILGVLFHETQREILLYVIRNPGANQRDLSSYVGISASSINWHMKRLKGSGLIQMKHGGNFVNYFVNGEIRGILGLLKSYQPSIWERWADRLADLLTEI